MSDEKNDFFNQIMQGNTAEFKVVDEPSLFDAVEEEKEETAVEEVKEEVAEEVVEESPKDDSQFANRELDIDALLLQKLEEKSGGKFKSFEDLIREEKRELDFKDEKSAKLFKAIKDQDLETVKEFIDKKLFDANKLKATDAVSLYYKEKYPDFTDEDIQEELYEKYGVGKLKLSQEDKDLMSEDEIKAYEKELKNGAREFKKIEIEAKRYLNDNKSVDFELPDVELGTKIPEDYIKYEDAQQKFVNEYQETQQQTQKQWEGHVSDLPKVLAQPFEFNINLGDKEGDFKFSYDLSDKQKGELTKILSDYGNTTNYDQKFVSKEGDSVRVDVASLAKAKASELFFNEILKSAVKEARNVGKNEILSKEIKNSDWSKNTPPANNKGGLNFFQQQMLRK